MVMSEKQLTKTVYEWNKLMIPEIWEPVGKLLLPALSCQGSVVPRNRKSKVAMGAQSASVPRMNNMVISLNVSLTGRCPGGQRTVNEMKIGQCLRLWFGLWSFEHILDNGRLAALLPVGFTVGRFETGKPY